MTSRHPGVVVVPDGAALAQALVERFIAAARDSLALRGRFDVALAGGSTPKAAYTSMAANCRDALDWEGVRVFFGDERCVPPESDESNYNMAKRAMLDALPIVPEHVFRMRGEDEPAAAARAYANILRSELGPDLRFDLVMLGMGTDAHTASLFPGTDPLEDDDALVRAPFVEKLGAFRLTLTPRMLEGARAIVIATSGPSKADALAAVLEEPRDPIHHPISIIEPKHGTLTWLVDEAAASKLAR